MLKRQYLTFLGTYIGQAMRGYNSERKTCTQLVMMHGFLDIKAFKQNVM